MRPSAVHAWRVTWPIALWGCLASCSKQGSPDGRAHDVPRAAPAPASQPAPLPAQAQPVREWLGAVRELDIERLRSVFAARLRDEFDKEGWDAVLDRYATLWGEKFGLYTLDDFQYTFEGDADSGTVGLTFRGKPLPPVQVVREGDAWKVNER